MKDAERVRLLRQAIAELKLTKDGFDPKAGHWRRAMGPLGMVLDDLKPKPPPPASVPPLGPIWRGGKSVLLHKLTHATGGIDLYPAFDDAFTAGQLIIAPEAIEVVRSSSSHPGDAFYALGRSDLEYWFGHLVSAPSVGRKFRKGETVGRVLKTSIGGGSHCHLGISIERLVGSNKQLKYGRTGRGPNYTWPEFPKAKVGEQLLALLR